MVYGHTDQFPQSLDHQCVRVHYLHIICIGGSGLCGLMRTRRSRVRRPPLFDVRSFCEVIPAPIVCIMCICMCYERCTHVVCTLIYNCITRDAPNRAPSAHLRAQCIASQLLYAIVCRRWTRDTARNDAARDYRRKYNEANAHTHTNIIVYTHSQSPSGTCWDSANWCLMRMAKTLRSRSN